MPYPVLLVLSLVPGVVAALIGRANAPIRLVERHHSHHDTYVVPPDFLRALVVTMLLVGCLGFVLGAFSLAGAFGPSARCVLAFTDAFVWTFFGAWVVLMRYKVSLFEDRGEIVPLIGRSSCFFYSDIEKLGWRGRIRTSGYRDLVIVEKDGKRLRIWGIVDIEQILLHIDRFDVLEPLAAGPEDAPELMPRALGPWLAGARQRPAEPAGEGSGNLIGRKRFEH